MCFMRSINTLNRIIRCQIWSLSNIELIGMAAKRVSLLILFGSIPPVQCRVHGGVEEKLSVKYYIWYNI